MNKVTQVGSVPEHYKDAVYPQIKINILNGLSSGAGNNIAFECRVLIPISRQGHSFLVLLTQSARVPILTGSYSQEREYEAQKKAMFVRQVLAEVENMQRYYVVDSNAFFNTNGEPIVWELMLP